MCRPAERCAPSSVEAIQQLIRDAAAAGRHVRPVGSGYSYTRLVQTDDVMLALDNWSGVESVDKAGGVAVVRAGTPLHQLERELAAHGVAMENLGDINRQTIAGAIATGTHGTGITLGNLSTRVLSLEMVTADGALRRLTPADGDVFRCAVLSLGTLGVIVRFSIAVVPMYWLTIERRRETFDSALSHLNERVYENRNYEFFWFPASDLVYSKAMNVAEPGSGGGRTIGRWVSDIFNENLAMWFICTANHHRPAWRSWLLDAGKDLVPQGSSVTRADAAFATERLVVHQECEYAMPAERAIDVLRELDERLRRFPTRTLFPIEVRFTRGDNVPLSPSYGRDVVWIAVHTWWKEDHEEYFDAAERIFLAAGGRPHWGKLHSLTADELARRYPEAGVFAKVRQGLDPHGVFMNGYLKRILPAG
jgi:FAD-linked oxidoreductase